MITPNRPVSDRNVARHYDELDGFYRELWGEHVHHGLWLTGRESPEEATRQLVDRVVHEAQIEPGDTVCDVGGGYGATARLLATEHQARVTTMTISADQHWYAQMQPLSTGPPPIYLLMGWLDHTLPPASFDAVICIESLAHMADKSAALAEAYRVLRPGGRLVACTWLAEDNSPGWARRFLLEPICREGQLPSLPAVKDYQQWIVEAGFGAPHFDDLSANVQRTWSVVIGRVVRAVARRPVYRRYLLDRTHQNRGFALSLLRLWLGFRTKTFRYGLFTAHKPA